MKTLAPIAAFARRAAIELGKRSRRVPSQKTSATAGTWSAFEALEARAYMTVSFAAAATYVLPTSSDSAAVVAADFTGDGKPDVAAVNQAEGVICLLVNNGDGTFATPIAVPTGAQPTDLATADFNGDGRADLAVLALQNVGLSTDDEIHILLNNGAGSFAAPIIRETGDTAPLSLTAADLNGDGKADVVTGPTFISNTAAVFMNTGTGVLADPVTYDLPSSGIDVTLGDVNNDAKPDLAFALENGAAAVLVNTGNGTFGAATLLTVGSTEARPEGVAIGQFVGDGSADLAVTMENGEGVALLAGNGAGAFTAAGNYTVPALNGVLGADFDADGQTDLAVTSRTGHYVSVLQRNAGDTFTETWYDFVHAKTHEVATADFNGDSKPDLVVTGETPGSTGTGVLDVLLNTSTGGNGTNGNGGGNAGGNTGGGTTEPGSADLVAALAVTSPASVIGGAKAKATVRIANQGSTPVDGPVEVRLYASADGTLDDTDTPIVIKSGNLKLKAGVAKNVKLAFAFPSAPSGTYTLLAKVDAAGAVSESDEGNNVAAAPAPVTIANAFVDLTGSFGPTPASLAAGKKGTIAVTIRNDGTVATKSAVTIKLYASTDGVLDAADVPLATLTKTLPLKAGTGKPTKIKFVVPSALAGRHTLIATLDAASAGEANVSSNTFFAGVPITFG